MSLVDSLAECLSNSVVLKNKAQGYHWNVMGPDFGEFHDFFGSYYEDVESAIDHLSQKLFAIVEFRLLTSFHSLWHFHHYLSQRLDQMQWEC
jgi:DNA-binding ferritin-like protein